jgi:hypothetical protein
VGCGAESGLGSEGTYQNSWKAVVSDWWLVSGRACADKRRRTKADPSTPSAAADFARDDTAQVGTPARQPARTPALRVEVRRYS